MGILEMLVMIKLKTLTNILANPTRVIAIVYTVLKAFVIYVKKETTYLKMNVL